MPSANPWRSAAYQPFTNGTPTANEAPANPSRKPKTIIVANESWNSASAISGSGVYAISAVKTIRPPWRSASQPSGIRISEPSSTGTATIVEVWTSESPSSSCRSGPSGPSSAHA